MDKFLKFNQFFGPDNAEGASVLDGLITAEKQEEEKDNNDNNQKIKDLQNKIYAQVKEWNGYEDKSSAKDILKQFKKELKKLDKNLDKEYDDALDEVKKDLKELLRDVKKGRIIDIDNKTEDDGEYVTALKKQLKLDEGDLSQINVKSALALFKAQNGRDVKFPDIDLSDYDETGEERELDVLQNIWEKVLGGEEEFNSKSLEFLASLGITNKEELRKINKKYDISKLERNFSEVYENGGEKIAFVWSGGWLRRTSTDSHIDRKINRLYKEYKEQKDTERYNKAMNEIKKLEQEHDAKLRDNDHDKIAGNIESNLKEEGIRLLLEEGKFTAEEIFAIGKDGWVSLEKLKSVNMKEIKPLLEGMEKAEKNGADFDAVTKDDIQSIEFSLVDNSEDKGDLKRYNEKGFSLDSKEQEVIREMYAKYRKINLEKVAAEKAAAEKAAAEKEAAEKEAAEKEAAEKAAAVQKFSDEDMNILMKELWKAGVDLEGLGGNDISSANTKDKELNRWKEKFKEVLNNKLEGVQVITWEEEVFNQYKKEIINAFKKDMDFFQSQWGFWDTKVTYKEFSELLGKDENGRTVGKKNNYLNVVAPFQLFKNNK